MLLLIGRGHGPNTFEDTGEKGIKGVVEEWDLNVLMADTLYNRIKSGGKITVQNINSSSIKYDMELSARKDFIKLKNPTLYISVHHDANDDKNVKGFTIYYWHSNPRTLSLAKNIRNELIKAGCTPSPIGNGIKACIPNVPWPNFYMLRVPPQDGLLIECGFFTNSGDIKLTKNSDYREKFCNAIYIGMCKQYGIINQVPQKIEPEYDEILRACLDEPEKFLVSVAAAIEVAKGNSNLGDLERLKYLPDMIEKVYKYGRNF